MVKLFIYSLLAIVIALFLTFYLDLTSDSGYLLLAWRNYTFETSLFAIVALFIAVFVVARLLLLLLSWINPLQLRSLGRKWQAGREEKGRSNTLEGLMHIARGNWQLAHAQLIRSVSDKDATLINHLAAAFAACEMGRKDWWLEILDQASKEYPQSLSTINTVRASLLFKTGQFEQCVVVLEKLRKTSLNDEHLLSLLKEVYLKLENWKQLRTLLPQLEKNKVINPAEQEQIEKRLLLEAMRSKVEEIRKDSSAKTSLTSELTKIWKKAPARFKEDEVLTARYIDMLLVISAGAEAARTIEHFLGRNWSDLLAHRYGVAEFGDSSKQLIHGEIWLKERPKNAALLLALGRICLRNRIWGKAREYFEASLAASPAVETYGELTRLTRNLGDMKSSERYLKHYTELLGKQLPDLPMPQSQERKIMPSDAT